MVHEGGENNAVNDNLLCDEVLTCAKISRAMSGRVSGNENIINRGAEQDVIGARAALYVLDSNHLHLLNGDSGREHVTDWEVSASGRWICDVSSVSK